MITIEEFREVVWQYYAKSARDLPWCQPGTSGVFDPYKIMVSEIMLQQTQATRVIPKYTAFIDVFPTVQALAGAPLADVITAWSGLGYNRRAKFLWEASRIIAGLGEGFPASIVALSALPGIGQNTAAAICAYAYNQPVVFIETNIRTVFIHHFFEHKDSVSDAELLPYVKSALDMESPREWYWALMDYGVHIKTTVGNVSRSSKHYTKQSTFNGSRRQLRGKIIRALTNGPISRNQLIDMLADERTESVLLDLTSEQLITAVGDMYSL